jgi:hypothetical protein
VPDSPRPAADDLEDVWLSDEVGDRPVKTACERGKFGYPNLTVTGQKMYENTAFRTEIEAWECLIRNVDAGQRISVMNVRDAERRLATAKEELVKDALRATEARDAFSRRFAKS